MFVKKMPKSNSVMVGSLTPVTITICLQETASVLPVQHMQEWRYFFSFQAFHKPAIYIDDNILQLKNWSTKK